MAVEGHEQQHMEEGAGESTPTFSQKQKYGGLHGRFSQDTPKQKEVTPSKEWLKPR